MLLNAMAALHIAFVWLLVLLLAGRSAASKSTTASINATIVVDVRSTLQLPIQTLLAVQTCAGLFNRQPSNEDAASTGELPAVYVLLQDQDAQWLSILEPAVPSPPPLVQADAFVTQCLGAPIVSGRIRYNFTAQQALVPLLLTAAGALNAVLLEDGSPLLPPGGIPVQFDAFAAWGGGANATTAASATTDAFRRFGNATTSLAWMNPGYEYSQDPLAPALTGLPDLSLADWVVSARLFNLYLPLGCVPFTEEHDALEAVVGNATWPTPITVWGYDDTLPLFGGDVFEAETTCTGQLDMGQAASSGVSNMAYTARALPVVEPLAQAPLPPLTYNASRTYVAFLVGDGDNIAYIKSTRFTWFQQRLAACAAVPRGIDCTYPLSWTISPHLLTAAPDVLRWYYAGAAGTGADYFLLPPSGHLYAYPGLMPDAVQAAFVAATEEDARLLNCSGSVEWELLGTWEGAAKNYMSRYAAVGRIDALFPVNVPYMVPLVELFPQGDAGPAVLNVGGSGSGAGNSSVFLFRPQEWRGTSGGGEPPFLFTPAQFAARLNSMPLGTVTHIYMTSDGGAVWTDFTALAAELAEHVQVVPAGSLGPLAAAAARSWSDPR